MGRSLKNFCMNYGEQKSLSLCSNQGKSRRVMFPMLSATWPFSVVLEGSMGFKLKIRSGDSLLLRRGAEQHAIACSSPSQRMPVTPEIPREVSMSHLWEAKVQGWWGAIWASCHLRCALLQILWEGDKALKFNKAAARGVWGTADYTSEHVILTCTHGHLTPACVSIYSNSTLIWSR